MNDDHGMTGYYSQRVFELERERTRLEARIDALVVERDLAQQGLAEAVAVIAAIYAKVRKYDSPLSSHLGPGMAVDALITLAERYGAALRAVRPVLGQVYRMIPGPEHAPQEREDWIADPDCEVSVVQRLIDAIFPQERE